MLHIHVDFAKKTFTKLHSYKLHLPTHKKQIQEENKENKVRRLKTKAEKLERIRMCPNCGLAFPSLRNLIKHVSRKSKKMLLLIKTFSLDQSPSR